MRSSVRSRLAPPIFQALRSDSNPQSVPFCSNKQFHNFRLAGKLPRIPANSDFAARRLIPRRCARRNPYLNTTENLKWRIALQNLAQLRIADFWFVPGDFANPAKRPNVRPNADRTQLLAVTISAGDKLAFNIFNEIHSAQIRSTFIHFKCGQLRLITENDIRATKTNCATERTCKACASRVTRRRQRNLTADSAIKQYLFQIVESGKFLAGWFVWGWG
jgi:hypothetical protein